MYLCENSNAEFSSTCFAYFFPFFSSCMLPMQSASTCVVAPCLPVTPCQTASSWASWARCMAHPSPSVCQPQAPWSGHSPLWCAVGVQWSAQCTCQTPFSGSAGWWHQFWSEWAIKGKRNTYRWQRVTEIQYYCVCVYCASLSSTGTQLWVHCSSIHIYITCSLGIWGMYPRHRAQYTLTQSPHTLLLHQWQAICFGATEPVQGKSIAFVQRWSWHHLHTFQFVVYRSAAAQQPSF